VLWSTKLDSGWCAIEGNQESRKNRVEEDHGHFRISVSDEIPALKTRRELWDSHNLWKIGSCTALLFVSMAATLFAEASKSADGTFPSYNSFMIPCAVEVVKSCASTSLCFFRVKGDVHAISSDLVNLQALHYLPSVTSPATTACFTLSKSLARRLSKSLTNNLNTSNWYLDAHVSRPRSYMGSLEASCLYLIGSTVTQLRTGECGDVKQSTLDFALS